MNPFEPDYHLTPQLLHLKMPEVTKSPEATQAKTQPWRAVWPAPEPASITPAGNMASKSGGGSGAYGYNDKGEGVPPTK